MTAQNPKPAHPSDEFELVTHEARPEIFAVGCDGAGCNTISRLMEMGVQGMEMELERPD